ncbi:MAG: TIGR03960 family B12-binding radical SAM protein [Lachnospiraceae bacterium]|nr:TIGR03960 family B12-binding radical SAM protein [Lachnospiraceae bacterium]
MRKLALSDDILLQVEKPARYVGGEVNMVVKDPRAVDIRFCMCFPDVYEVGMSHLGIQILYDMFNRREDTYCERVYSPWMDLDPILRERNIPLFALESQEPVKNFDFLGITLQYEMCYTNILQILDLSQIPIFAKDRGEDDPIVIGGGPCAYNPEPIADFFDFFYIGEGETVYDQVLDLYKENKKNGGTRQDYLAMVATIEGMYVPSLYDVAYHEDGTIASFTPNHPNARPTIRKQVEMQLSDTFYPEKPLVPFIKTVQDRVVLEIQRGCIRGCRFCQAGMLYRPIRERDVEFLKERAKLMISNTGQEEITLSSLSSSDYKALPELVYYLIDEFGKQKVNISLPSLRIDAFALDVMSKVQDVKKSSLTFAPEAGSQRMRNVINKGLTEENILKGSMDAFRSGWNKVKLYFMLGLPSETQEDIEAIAVLSDRIAQEYYTIPKSERNGKVQIITSTSFFVPKPFTPFQWVSMNTQEQFLTKQKMVSNKLKELINNRSIRYNWHDADVTIMEGIFARGDRRLAKSIYDAYKAGCIYDAWSEYFRFDLWAKTFEENGVDISFYTSRERAKDEIFPWDFIDAGVTKEFLWREYQKGLEETVTPNCRKKCAGCGARSFNGGVCYETPEEV